MTTGILMWRAQAARQANGRPAGAPSSGVFGAERLLNRQAQSRSCTNLRIAGVHGLLLWGLLSTFSMAEEIPATRPPLPKIRIALDHRGFITEQGQPFVPFGVTYFRPGTGWAPQVWKQFDPEATREDFARLRRLGGNCVRVFLSFGSFYGQPGRLSTNGLAKFDRFLSLAEEAGLYVQPTGPDHWEGVPAWARGDRFASEPILSAVEQFWKLLAARYRGRSVLLCYELLNEPEIGWDTADLQSKWRVWLQQKYGSATNLASAWSMSNAGPPGTQTVPPKQGANNRQLLDYQHFRESIAQTWTARQVGAIKSADPQALVTVGLIQCSVPVCLAGLFQYSAFRPEQQARWLDFLEFHFYPLADGFYDYKNVESERRNLAYLDCLGREMARCGKPVVLGEYGWYGGGQPTCAGGHQPFATEEQQARWCRHAVETSSKYVCGWLHWGFYDHPGANDVTELIGLLKTDGKPKAWSQTFRELAGHLSELTQRSDPNPPGLGIDWERDISDPEAMHKEWTTILNHFHQDKD